MEAVVFDPVEMRVKLNNKAQVAVWQGQLRKHLYEVRGRRCDKCKKPLSLYAYTMTSKELASLETHEGIVSKANLMGQRLPKKAYIFTEVNTLILCPTCHRPNPPDRQWAWDYLCEFYGEEIVRTWHEGLQWKTGRPPRYF